MSRYINYRVKDAIDMARFARAVADGLSARELAERFGLPLRTAKHEATKIRKAQP